MNGPEEQVFVSFAEYRAAVLDALAQARRFVTIFDPDLRECGLESRAGIRLLEELCTRATRPETLRVLLQTTAWAERECPRLLALLARYGHCATVRTAGRDARSWSQPFLIVDNLRVVTRFHVDLPKGKTASESSPALAFLSTQFETFWMNATPSALGAPLGL